MLMAGDWKQRCWTGWRGRAAAARGSEWRGRARRQRRVLAGMQRRLGRVGKEVEEELMVGREGQGRASSTALSRRPFRVRRRRPPTLSIASCSERWLGPGPHYSLPPDVRPARWESVWTARRMSAQAGVPLPAQGVAFCARRARGRRQERARARSPVHRLPLEWCGHDPSCARDEPSTSSVLAGRRRVLVPQALLAAEAALEADVLQRRRRERRRLGVGQPLGLPLLEL